MGLEKARGTREQAHGETRRRKGGAEQAGRNGAAAETAHRYCVEHPQFGATEVCAENRLQAITAAAKVWGVRWTGIATACRCERLEKRG